MCAMDVKSVKSGLLKFLLITAISVSVSTGFRAGSADAQGDHVNDPPRNAIIMIETESKPCGAAMSEAEDYGTLSGIVTADGVALSGALVELRRPSFDCGEYGAATTATDGSYSISISGGGQVYLKITPPVNENGDVYAPYYYSNQYDQCGETQPITIIAGDTTTLDINLTQPGGIITGTVVSYDGKPLSGALVYCGQTIDHMFYHAITDAEGKFTRGPLYPATDYKCFIHDNGKTLYYDNTTGYYEYTPITVQAKSVTSNIDFQLSKPLEQSRKVVVIPLLGK